MRTHLWFLLAVLFLLAGCTKDLEVVSSLSDVRQDVVAEKRQSSTVTTVDGTLSAFGCSTLTLKTGEIYQICKPANWNGDLILYAHGYVSSYLPLAIPTEADAYVPLFLSQGYAFATTSYSANGLAIQTGIDDMLELRKFFIKQYGTPKNIYLTGGSEGGIVTTLAIERYPKLFSGGLSLCGPCGDFQRQINRYGDVRVLFDYFFPGILPGTAINIPDQLIQNWPGYSGAVGATLINNSEPGGKTWQFLATAFGNEELAGFLQSPENIGETVLSLLWYNVFATRNAVEVLKGQPYDNIGRVYINPFFAGNPAANAMLNQQVQRIAGDKKAMKTIEKDYQTSGLISVPLVTMHTAGDPLIPVWHLPLYQQKTLVQGTSALFTGIPINRFGHCTFTQLEVAMAFGALVQQVSGQMPAITQRLIEKGKATDGKIVQSVNLIRTEISKNPYAVSAL
ncbi:alpha/beta hydrolase [Nibrella viscosa]|uniref:Alpha/beta hydrolase n=1 Tax=Nibrella viscosa TaxID=1084524 RepID=A0ABP8KID4_9BACT